MPFEIIEVTVTNIRIKNICISAFPELHHLISKVYSSTVKKKEDNITSIFE